MQEEIAYTLSERKKATENGKKIKVMKGISLISGVSAIPFSVAGCCNALNGRLKHIARFHLDVGSGAFS